nr:MAG TPA: replication initiator protein [Caudoviricetes sp.]
MSIGNRRMFSRDIVESDAFMSLSDGAKVLYFYLCMNADDDGFCNCPRKIMTSCGAKDDDMKLLIAKKFILWFDGAGISVIKHWRIHNYIRKDRYCETKYRDLMRALYVDDSNIYSLRDAEKGAGGIPDGNRAVDKRLTDGIPSDNRPVDGRYTVRETSGIPPVDQVSTGRYPSGIPTGSKAVDNRLPSGTQAVTVDGSIGGCIGKVSIVQGRVGESSIDIDNKNNNPFFLPIAEKNFSEKGENVENPVESEIDPGEGAVELWEGRVRKALANGYLDLAESYVRFAKYYHVEIDLEALRAEVTPDEP